MGFLGWWALSYERATAVACSQLDVGTGVRATQHSPPRVGVYGLYRGRENTAHGRQSRAHIRQSRYHIRASKTVKRCKGVTSWLVQVRAHPNTIPCSLGRSCALHQGVLSRAKQVKNASMVGARAPKHDAARVGGHGALRACFSEVTLPTNCQLDFTILYYEIKLTSLWVN